MPHHVKLSPQGHTALRTLACALFACAATQAALAYMDAGAVAAQSAMWLLLFAAVAHALRRAMRIQARRVVVVSLTLSLLYAACLIAGHEIASTYRLGGLLFSPQALLRTVWRVVGVGALCYAPLALFLHRASRSADTEPSTDWAEKLARPRAFGLLWIVMLLCWLPYVLSFFPGNMTGDSVLQLEQAAGTLPLSDAHPVMHTAVFALCIRLTAWLGIPHAAVACCSTLQALGMTAILVYACQFLVRALRVPGWQAALAYAFFALLPVHPLLGITLWKDVPHAGTVLLLVLQLMAFTLTPREAFASRRRCAALIVILFFFATLRHNGLYSCIVLLPWFVWRFRAYARRALAICLTTAALLALYRGPVLGLLQPARGSAAEALSIPLQQLARVVTYESDRLSASDRDAIAEILPYAELPQLYHPQISDPVKARFDADAFRRAPGRYAALWLRLVAEYPLLSLDAFLCNNYGYWYPGVQYIISPYDTMPTSLGSVRHSMGIPDAALRDFVEYRLRRAPGLSLLFTIGSMTWLLALAVAVLCVRRQPAALTPLLPLLLIWLWLLSSAVFAEYRYAYGLILCAPVCLLYALHARTGPPPRRAKIRGV